MPYGGSDEDVSYIRDSGTTGTISESSIKIKRSLSERLKKEPWNTIMDNYEKVKGPSEVHGPIMLDLQHKAQELLDIECEDQDLVLDLFKKFAASIKEWQADLNVRGVGTKHVEEVVLKVVRFVYTAHRAALESDQTPQAMRTDALAKVHLMLPVLKLFSTKEGKDLLQQASDLSATWGDKDKLTALAELAGSPVTDSAGVAALYEKLVSAQTLTKGKELVKSLADQASLVLKLISDVIQAHSKQEVQVDVHFKLLETLKKDQEICDLVGGRTKFTKAINDTRQIATDTCTIISTSSRVHACADKDPDRVLSKAICDCIAAVDKRPKHRDIQDEDCSIEDDPLRQAAEIAWELIATTADDVITDIHGEMMTCSQKLHSLELDKVRMPRRPFLTKLQCCINSGRFVSSSGVVFLFDHVPLFHLQNACATQIKTLEFLDSRFW